MMRMQRINWNKQKVDGNYVINDLSLSLSVLCLHDHSNIIKLQFILSFCDLFVAWTVHSMVLYATLFFPCHLRLLKRDDMKSIWAYYAVIVMYGVTNDVPIIVNDYIAMKNWKKNAPFLPTNYGICMGFPVKRFPVFSTCKPCNNHSFQSLKLPFKWILFFKSLNAEWNGNDKVKSSDM